MSAVGTVFLVLSLALPLQSRPAGTAGLRPGHVINKRFESHVDTDFMQKSITVNEDVDVLVDTLCVKGGPNKRSFGLFSARGFPDSCSRGPCPEATENVDYNRVFVDEFRPHPGELICFNVTILNDNITEGREFFLVGLLDLRWGEILSTASITIMDDDSPALMSVSEMVPESVDEVEFCLTGGLIDLPLVIQTNSTDIMDLSVEFLTISPNETVCVNVTVVDDELFEGLETAEISIKSANISIGNFSETFTLFIMDDDNTPQFQQSSFIVNESVGVVEVCVNFTSNSQIMPVQSSLVVNDVSARSGSDYTGFQQLTFQILPGEGRCVTIPIIDDEVAERVELFTITLNSSNVQNAQSFQASVAIMDDDVITFQENTYQSIERENGVEVCVFILGGRGTKNGVIATQSGSAKERLDFFPLNYRPFTITGSNVECFFIYNFRDNIPEPLEEFTVEVYTLLSDRQAIDVRTAQVLLEDDDGTFCVNLTTPVNGHLTSMARRIRPGYEIQYTCNSGFQLNGQTTRTCMASGEWTGSDPTCVEIFCPTLSDPLNGRVTVPSRTVNSVATYSCNSGFNLINGVERVCMVNGMWFGFTPVCQLIECPLLSSPTNGTVSQQLQRIPGTMAQYSCDAGFVLSSGNSQRFCLNDGTWNGTEPSCLALRNIEPITLKLVNDSPKIDGRTVSIEVSVSGAVDKVICSLDDKVVEEDFRNKNKSEMDFTEVFPGGHTLELTATSLVFQGEMVHVERFFEIGSSPTFCGLHLINEGAVTHSHKLRVEFAAVPSAEFYRCKLDSQPGFNCNSTVEMSGLRPGPHRLKIMHNKDECGYRRKLFIHFNIENTPDNPYNNL